jgi:hypothetical protein
LSTKTVLMPQNSPISSTVPRRDSEVLRAVENLLADRLPRGWTADLEPAPTLDTYAHLFSEFVRGERVDPEGAIREAR